MADNGFFSLEKVFDVGTGIFKEFLDFEKFELQLEAAKDLQLIQSAQASAAAPVTRTGPDLAGLVQPALMVAIVGGVAWAGFKLLKSV